MHRTRAGLGRVLNAQKDRPAADTLHTLRRSSKPTTKLPPPPPAGYSRDVGPGVWDIHSPVVPSVEWIAAKLRSFVEVGEDCKRCVCCACCALGGQLVARRLGQGWARSRRGLHELRVATQRGPLHAAAQPSGRAWLTPTPHALAPLPRWACWAATPPASTATRTVA